MAARRRHHIIIIIVHEVPVIIYKDETRRIVIKNLETCIYV